MEATQGQRQRGVELSEDEQESDSDSEEENKYQEEISLEDKKCNKICSVCKSGGSVLGMQQFFT